MALPTGFTTYQQVLARNNMIDSGKNEEVSGVADRTETTVDGPVFNSKFEDVNEFLENGKPILIIRAQDQHKRTQGHKRRFGEYSLLLRRMIDVDKKENPISQLEIQSEILRAEFRQLASGIKSISLYHDPIIIFEPYKEIFYCKDRIQDALNKASTQTIRQELQLLVDFQKQYMSETINTINSFKKSGTVEFGWLWAFFLPGTDVVIQNTTATGTPIEWCAVLRSCSIVGDPISWEVTVAHTGFNGQQFGTVLTNFSFLHFSGIVPINQLPVYPLEFCNHRQSLRDRAIARGMKYEEYCLKSSKGSGPPIGCPRVYNGPFWSKNKPPWRDQEDRRGYQMHDNPSRVISGRVVVDVEGFLSRLPILRDTIIPDKDNNFDDSRADSSQDSSSPYSRRRLQRQLSPKSWGVAPQQHNVLSSDQYSTCPPFIPAFSLKARKWGLLLIEGLQEIPWDASVYENLHIDTKIKGTLRELVNSHSAHSDDIDFVQDKGRGLVVLLYGPPGSGKTMTAESIAESSRKLLYAVTGGELGTTVTSVQEKLEEVFMLAARWQAILLIDEADSFLIERRGNSIERNALISVFLRVLEYQTGILFLTTNRFIEFDTAARSRIHMIIPYAELTDEQRRAIWKTLAHEKCNCNLSDEELSALVKLRLDGRTIKNTLRLASLLAKSRDSEEDVTYSDIEAILPIAVGDAGTGTASGKINLHGH